MPIERRVCVLCQACFAADEVIELNDEFVCAACKPLLVQRLREGLSMPSGAVNAWRSGNLVVTTDGASLLGRCAKCNATEPLAHTSRAHYWHPRWVIALLLLTPIVYAVGVVATQRSARVGISVCRRHLVQRRLLVVAGWHLATVGLAAGILVISKNSYLLALPLFGLIAVGSLLVYSGRTFVSAQRIEGEYIWLRGFCRPYVDSLPEFRGPA